MPNRMWAVQLPCPMRLAACVVLRIKLDCIYLVPPENTSSLICGDILYDRQFLSENYPHVVLFFALQKEGFLCFLRSIVMFHNSIAQCLFEEVKCLLVDFSHESYQPFPKH